MKTLILIIIIGALCLWAVSKEQDNCNRKGGVLVKGALGYQCVKGELVP